MNTRIGAWPWRVALLLAACVCGCTGTAQAPVREALQARVALPATDPPSSDRWRVDMARLAAQDAVRDAFPDWLDGIDGWSIETNLFVDRAHVSVKGRGVLVPFRWWEVRLDGNVASDPVRRS